MNERSAPTWAESRNYPLNCWYVAATSEEVGPQLLARRLLGQAVVLYRQASGTVVALEDRCPHRSAPLSRGRLVDDQVVCGYHGFVFGSTGECVRVPSQDHVPYGSRVRAFPVREEPPFVWLWAGDAAKSTRSAPPRLPWLREAGWTGSGGLARVRANYMLLHENALDLTHFPFVHGEASPAGYLTVPPPLEVEITENSVSYSRTFSPAPLVDWQVKATGLSRDRTYAQRESGTFVSPAMHIDHMDVIDRNGGGAPRVYEKVFVRAFTPETSVSTLLFWQVVRNYAPDDTGVTEHLSSIHQRLMNEDKDLLEDIQTNADGHHPEFNVSADVAALRAHHIVNIMLAEERGRAPLRPGFGDLTARH